MSRGIKTAIFLPNNISSHEETVIILKRATTSMAGFSLCAGRSYCLSSSTPGPLEYINYPVQLSHEISTVEPGVRLSELHLSVHTPRRLKAKTLPMIIIL